MDLILREQKMATGRVRQMAETIELVLRKLEGSTDKIEIDVSRALCGAMDKMNEKLKHERKGALNPWWKQVEAWKTKSGKKVP